jgi:hypothetical protein
MTDADLSKFEWLRERAAILEIDAGFDRPTAERVALALWEKYRKTFGDD